MLTTACPRSLGCGVSTRTHVYLIPEPEHSASLAASVVQRPLHFMCFFFFPEDKYKGALIEKWYPRCGERVTWCSGTIQDLNSSSILILNNLLKIIQWVLFMWQLMSQFLQIEQHPDVRSCIFLLSSLPLESYLTSLSLNFLIIWAINTYQQETSICFVTGKMGETHSFNRQLLDIYSLLI